MCNGFVSRRLFYTHSDCGDKNSRQIQVIDGSMPKRSAGESYDETLASQGDGILTANSRPFRTPLVLCRPLAVAYRERLAGELPTW